MIDVFHFDYYLKNKDVYKSSSSIYLHSKNWLNSGEQPYFIGKKYFII